MNVTQIVTHSGIFHADDVMAGGVLRDLFPDAKLIRTRDPKLTQPASGRVVFDVGGVFDPSSMIFDHHQKDAPKRESGGAYSSFGMIWAQFGKAWLRLKGVHTTIVPEVWRRIDDEIVSVIDGYDNGETSPADLGRAFGISMISLVADTVPAFDQADEAALSRGYDEACALGSHMLLARARSVSNEIRARMIVERAVTNAAGEAVIELPFSMNYDQIIHDIGADHVEFVVYPRGDDWGIGVVSSEAGSFDARRDLPKAWGGLSGDDLIESSGIGDAIFCHAKLFFACAGSREGVMRMARMALGKEPDGPTIH